MRPATARRHAMIAVETRDGVSHRLAGLLIASLLPALFWTALVALGGSALGAPVSALALATFGAAVAAFLAAVLSALRGV